MDLSSFITTHREQILETWEEAARARVQADQHASLSDLRDHLGELLGTVARGLSDASGARVEAVAEKHGSTRAAQGLSVKEVVAEFPILRSCVTRLWLDSLETATATDLRALMRFDEALDRALTQSVAEFIGELDESRETFLGILGHDLRDPLATIIAGSKLLLEEDLDRTDARDIVSRIVATGERMHHLVVDFLDFTRTELGGRMPISRRDADLGRTIRHLVAEFTTSNPTRTINLRVGGDLRGEWDEERLGQAVANLLANALRHGAKDSPIDISVAGNDEVLIAVHNEGPSIPEARHARVFKPMGGIRGEGPAGRRPGHLGLGLYIANAIVAGHDGHIDIVSSPERGTTFTIHLPRA